jgi:hypothetical protein
MGSFLVKLLTDPEDFKFYSGNAEGQVGSVSTVTSFGQKSIPFGNDRPGGGSSKQPYVKNPIKEDFKNPAFYNDFIIRGGILSATSAAEDVVRLTKYFSDISNPSGILFAAKQNILSRVGVKTEANQPTPAYLGGALNEGVYLPTSTLAQALVGFAGTTLNKQGIDPTGLVPGLAIRDYQTAVYKRNQNQTIESSTPKSVQRKVDKINQNILKKSEELQQTQILSSKQNAYNPVVPTPLNFSFLGNDKVDQLNNQLNEKEQKQYESDVKWDQIKEERLKKRVNNLESELETLQEDLTSIIGGTFSNRLLKLWDKFGLNPDNEKASNGSVLLSYGGGPGSALGFSRTKIKFATSNDGQTPLRTGYVMIDPYEGTYRNHSPGNLLQYGLDTLFDGKQLKSSVYRQYQSKKNPSITEEQYFGTSTYFATYDGKDNIQPWLFQPVYNSYFSTWDQSQFTAQPLNTDAQTKEDFRKSTPTSPSSNSFLTSTSGYTFNPETPKSGDFDQRFNLTGKSGFSAGSNKRNRSFPLEGSIAEGQVISKPLDSINAYPIYKSEFKDGSRYGKPGIDELNDIVEFSIGILNNDDQNKPVNGITGLSYRKYMHFRAFIDTFSDSYDAEWNAISYMGRGEKFYKYGGFDRKIQMGFTVVALSKDELNIMYDKLNFLASSLAPEYLDSLTSGYMAGNIAYITLGDYINDQPGIITSLTYDIPEESPWEINRDASLDQNGNVIGGVRQLPHMIKVSLNFTPIHKFRPSKQTWKNDFTPAGEGKALSTVLADPGNQRYIDPNNNFNGRNTDAGLEEARIALQNQIQTNQIVSAPVDPSVTLGDQSGAITGLGGGSGFMSNTIQP